MLLLSKILKNSRVFFRHRFHCMETWFLLEPKWTQKLHISGLIFEVKLRSMIWWAWYDHNIPKQTLFIFRRLPVWVFGKHQCNVAWENRIIIIPLFTLYIQSITKSKFKMNELICFQFFYFSLRHRHNPKNRLNHQHGTSFILEKLTYLKHNFPDEQYIGSRRS